MRSSALTRGTVALTATLTTAAVSAALLTAGAGAAGAATTPPYEPDGRAVGTITFYDTTGNIITSGSTQNPFAGYAVGSAAPRSGDQKAGLVFANPNPNSKTYDWYAQLTGTFTSYPATTAPTSISSQTTPVYTVGSGDETIDEFESTATQYTGTGYTNMVQVRLQTANAAGNVTKTYDDADLLIDPAAHTWTEVYPTGGVIPPATPDATSVSVSVPGTVKYGSSAKITGTLKDTTKNRALSGQSVGLYERANSKAAAKLVKKVKSGSNGSLSTTVKLTGAEQFQWRLAGSSAYKASSSSFKSVAVSTSVAISVDPRTVKHGKSAVFYGTTTPATRGIRVYLQQKIKGKFKNVASVKTKRQKLPNHKTTVSYRFSRKFGKKGTFTFRVSKPKTATLRTSVSKTITEHVK